MQQTATEIAVPMVTIANISSIKVESNSVGTSDPSFTSTGKMTINPKPQPIINC